MRLVYTNESTILVLNAKNLLDNEGISTSVKNEHSATGGHVNFVHMELWVNQDSDHERAINLLASIEKNAHLEDWKCAACEEENDASFDICWNCSGDVSQQ